MRAFLFECMSMTMTLGLFGVTSLTGYRNNLVALFLHDLVATEAALVGLLEMESSVVCVFSLLARLVMTTGRSTALHVRLTVPSMMAGCTFDLGCAVLCMRKIDQSLSNLHAFWRAELQVGGSFNRSPGKGGSQKQDTECHCSHN